MRVSMKRIWLWLKLLLIILVVVWVTLFFAMNSKHETIVWLFPFVDPTIQSLDVIVPITAIVAVLVFYIVRKVAAVLHEMNQLRLVDQAKEREKRMESLSREMEKKMTTPGAPKDPGK